MLHTTTAGPRRAEPGIDVHPEARELTVSAPGDFATGMRTARRPAAIGDFATGMRAARRPAAIGDFATGMRTARWPARMGDFATGMRSAPARVHISRDAAVDDSALPIAA
jgi:hypothetical protein